MDHIAKVSVVGIGRALARVSSPEVSLRRVKDAMLHQIVAGTVGEPIQQETLTSSASTHPTARATTVGSIAKLASAFLGVRLLWATDWTPAIYDGAIQAECEERLKPSQEGGFGWWTVTKICHFFTYTPDF